MEVVVTFTTQLKAALGQPSATLTLDEDASVMSALSSLAGRYPTEFSGLVLSSQGQLLPSILLCVNDQQVAPSALLHDGDTLTLLSAISGG